MSRSILVCLLAMLLPALALAEEVRLYTSVDQPIAAKVIGEFEKQTGITVRMLTDAEATKTVGLAERLRAEKANPRADVWWSNEIFHTIRLANDGILARYESPASSDIPAQFVDGQRRWMAAGIRIRVLLAAEGVQVAGYQDLLRPEFKGKMTLAKPAFGTTGGHMGALRVLLGEEKYLAYLAGLQGNGLKVVGGNSIAADMVASGQMLVCFTDNDDAAGVIAGGAKVKMVVPDQEEGGMGTLAMPCSVGLVAGARNEEAAKKLCDFLVSRQVEQMLVEEKFAYASVRDVGGKLKVMKVDFAEVAQQMPAAINLALQQLEK